jgi:translation elongation factor EF-Ts
MAVTPAMIKELRETTGAGMLDCKKSTKREQRRYGRCT